jgi:hypothetical protein
MELREHDLVRARGGGRGHARLLLLFSTKQIVKKMKAKVVLERHVTAVIIRFV